MDELYTIREIADRFKVSASSLYRYVEQGIMPHTRIGINIRFTKEHIADFLSQKRRNQSQSTYLQEGTNDPVYSIFL
jgi:excisionase family DNA binding protein